MVTLSALGTLAWSADGARDIEIPWRVPTALLLYLACHDGWLDRAQLAAWLRPDADEETALAYLRRVLHRAREESWAASLEAEKTRVRFAVASDVQSLRQAYQRRAWAEVVALYRGHFMAGAADVDVPPLDGWVTEMRSRLRSHWRAAAFAHAESLEEAGQADAAFDLVERVVDDDPLDEEALQMLLARAAAPAQAAIALRHFDRFVAEAGEELGVAALPATTALATHLRNRAPDVVQPVPRAAAAGALPPDATPLMGRERELTELAALAKDPAHRLITLVGLGGIGKTRLAIGAARELADAGEAVWLAKLAGVHDADGLRYAMADALGLRLGGRDLQAALEDVLREKAGWLVLDNAEHLTEAAEVIRRVLEAAPALRMLVTSRTPLGLVAEWRFPVEGLDLAEDGAAYRLLEASARRHGNAPGPADRGDAAAICRLVAGSPLALELAGSWAGAISFRALAGEIGKSPGFLVATESDREPRHASLATVFEASWAHLTPRLRTRLAALGVFVGGFDAEAAAAVAEATLADLLALAGLSLLRRQGTERFDVHPLIQHFSRARLAPAEAARLGGRHARHYIDRIAQDPRLRRGDFDIRALTRVEADFANIDAAWTHAVTHGMLDALTPLLANIDVIFARRGRDLMGYRLYKAAMEAAPADSELRARFAVRLAGVADALGHKDEAKRLHAWADRFLTAPADRIVLLNGLCVSQSAGGDNPAAIASAREAVRLAREARLPFDEIHALQNVAMVEMQFGESDAALRNMQDAIALSIAHDVPHHAAVGRFRLGHVIAAQGRYAEARDLLEDSLAALRRCGDRYFEAYALSTLCEIKVEMGDAKGAMADSAAAVALGSELGIALRLPMMLATAAWSEIAGGEHAAARETVRRGLTLALRQSVMAAQLRLVLAAATLRPIEGAWTRERADEWVRAAAEHPAFREDYRRDEARARAAVGRAGEERGGGRERREWTPVVNEVMGWLDGSGATPVGSPR